MEHFPLTESALGSAVFFFLFFSLQVETIFTCITELLSPVESGLVFLKGQRQDY